MDFGGMDFSTFSQLLSGGSVGGAMVGAVWLLKTAVDKLNIDLTKLSEVVSRKTFLEDCLNHKKELKEDFAELDDKLTEGVDDVHESFTASMDKYKDELRAEFLTIHKSINDDLTDHKKELKDDFAEVHSRITDNHDTVRVEFSSVKQSLGEIKGALDMLHRMEMMRSLSEQTKKDLGK